MNHVTLMGRLTRDPELRHTGTGTPVASFTLAVDRPHSKDHDKEADFIDCVAWRNTAEFISKYFFKGQQMALTGRLQIRDWTDKDGNKRRSAEVVVDNAYFCGSKNQDTKPEYKPASSTQFEELEDDDGDLPF